jgi:hypothetical protein
MGVFNVDEILTAGGTTFAAIQKQNEKKIDKRAKLENRISFHNARWIAQLHSYLSQQAKFDCKTVKNGKIHLCLTACYLCLTNFYYIGY